MDHWSAYEYTIEDLRSSLSCPQCRAAELLDAVGLQESEYARGQRIACREVLGDDHRCGKPRHEYPPAGEKCPYFAPYMGGRIACVKRSGHGGDHKAPGIFSRAAAWMTND